jgi:uncharacterized protein
MKILITGGTGFIGKVLTRSLLKDGHEVTVLSRNPSSVEKLYGPEVKALGNLQQITSNSVFDIVVNLAGAPIFANRWSESRKKLIRESRISLTEALVAGIAQMSTKPRLLISGSAIGFYGDQGDTVLTEQSNQVEDFSQTLCADWEASARKAEDFGVRVCLIRTGLVIGPGGGLLQRMVLPFRLGLGGRIGSGNQWMSWIHVQDWINIAHAMIKDVSMQGAYNATAPSPVTNLEFTKTLAACLKRPALLPVPGWLLKNLLGEMSQLILGSQRVVPQRLLEKGFNFQFTDLASALNQALSDP